MLCVVTPKKSVSNLSGSESVWVVDARRAIPDPDTLGNCIPDWQHRAFTAYLSMFACVRCSAGFGFDR